MERRYAWVIHPLQAVLLAGSLSLFLGALVSDVAYFKTYQIQWQNFASWLIVGGLFFSGFALIFAIVDWFSAVRRAAGSVAYGIVLLVTWLLAFYNALVHARDAWASMPASLVLSAIVMALIVIATWLGFYRGGRTDAY